MKENFTIVLPQFYLSLLLTILLLHDPHTTGNGMNIILRRRAGIGGDQSRPSDAGNSQKTHNTRWTSNRLQQSNIVFENRHVAVSFLFRKALTSRKAIKSTALIARIVVTTVVPPSDSDVNLQTIWFHQDASMPHLPTYLISLVLRI